MNVKKLRNVPTFGIDEAGRGPLAGPVAVAVFGMKRGIKHVFKLKRFPKNRDSKKMTMEEREKWFDIFNTEQKNGNVYFEIAFSSSSMIDKKGIVFAIKNAMQKCLTKLSQRKVLYNDCLILLDGALKAPEEFRFQKTIIKGDEKEKLIACASIVAKVSRDRLMIKLSKKYPEYSFEKHKGYGTKKHKEFISKYGMSKVHRKSFLRPKVCKLTK